MRFTGKIRQIALMASLMTLALVVGAATTVLGAGGSGGESGSGLHAWGTDYLGQLGDGLPVSEGSRTPVEVSNISCATSVAVSGTNGIAALGDGSVQDWGADSMTGGLGDNGALEPYSLTPVSVGSISTATQVAADNADMYAVLNGGTAVGWGDDRYGEFGNGEDPLGRSATPVRVAESLSDILEISAADKGATLALLSTGEVDSWGDGLASTLGRSGSGLLPGPVESEAKGTPLQSASAVSAGPDFGLAIVGGEVKAWGASEAPESNAVLGAGEQAIPGNVPVTVGGETPLTEVTKIVAGGNFGLALTKGVVEAWGSDVLGQLGNGAASLTPYYLPAPVTGLPSGIVAIAAVGQTGYAVDSGGHVWAWGNNEQGELGTGSGSKTSATPVEIGGLGAGNRGLADGIDAEFELAIGPASTCGSSSSTTSTTSTVQTSSAQTSTSQSSGSSPNGPGASSTSPTSPSGLATTEASAQLALKCSGRKLALTDVVQAGAYGVKLDGVAASSLAGHRIKILFDGRDQVASATVAATGLFSASAPAPPAKLRGSNNARYLAESGSLKSLDLKLTRRLILDPPTSSAGKVTLTGEVERPLAKPPAEVVVQQQISCSHTSTVARFKPGASGHFQLTIPAAASGAAAIYRLSTKVRGSTASSKLFSTFSLPEPVSVTA